MITRLVVVCLLGSASSVVAQSRPEDTPPAIDVIGTNSPFTTVGRFDLHGLVDLRTITAVLAVEANGVPGDELLIYNPRTWGWTLAVIHPTKSGLRGAIATGGLCTEPIFMAQVPGDQFLFMSVTVFDYDGDGLSDFMLWSPGNGGIRAELVRGTGARFCR